MFATVGKVFFARQVWKTQMDIWVVGINVRAYDSRDLGFGVSGLLGVGFIFRAREHHFFNRPSAHVSL